MYAMYQMMNLHGETLESMAAAIDKGIDERYGVVTREEARLAAAIYNSIGNTYREMHTPFIDQLRKGVEENAGESNGRD